MLLREPAPRLVGVDAVLFGHRLQEPLEVAALAPGPGGDGPLLHAEVGVGDDHLRVDLETGAEAATVLARSIGRVEREVPGRQLLEREPAWGRPGAG